MKRAKTSWTKPDLAILKKRKAEGKSFEEIGEELGRTAKACRSRFEYLSSASPRSHRPEFKFEKVKMKTPEQVHAWYCINGGYDGSAVPW